MWNCLFWPLSASYIHICIAVDLAIKMISCSKDGGYICLWVSMTTLNSEEITLSSDSVEWGEVYLPLSVNDNIEQWRDHSVLCYCYPGGYICLECQWQHWTVKRSLWPLLNWPRGDICLWVSMTTLNSEEITLSSATVTKGGISAFECQWQHWTVKRSLCPLLIDQGGISAFESQWQHWTVKRTLCPLLVLNGGEVYLPLSLNDNIEQWRDHSVLW